VFPVRIFPSSIAATAISLIAILSPQAHARDLYGQVGGSNVVLVTPQGEILDYIPEAGSVSVRRDSQGHRVLIDRGGNIVATEMPVNRPDKRSKAAANRGWGVARAPWDPEPGNQGYANSDSRTWDNNNDLATGTLPNDVDNADISVESQQLPDVGNNDLGSNDNGDLQTRPDDSETASLGPNGEQLSPLPDTLERAAPKITMNGKSSAEIAALQVFLDREGMSPGVIDGRMGDNVDKALLAYETTTGEKIDPNNSEDILQRLSVTGGLPFIQYTITAADAAGPYVASIPEDYSKKAQLPAMGYTSTTEMLAERFHMDENYLKSLNPNIDFSIPGNIVKVVDPGKNKAGEVTRIVANKAIKEVQAFDAAGNLVAVYPATIGSSDTPSPSGTHTVQRVAFNPNYTYNPKINFKQGANDKVLTIPPGPNSPVGNVWIALSKPTYGIHGTPEPSKIGKTQSHGCVRLTNWDAQELAHMVKPGTIVQFID
jgi:lipoprotein-anchoring transpeptidase ErfK/SrfK